MWYVTRNFGVRQFSSFGLLFFPVKIVGNVTGDVDFSTLEGQTPLMLACAKYRINVVQFLLDAGANASFQDNYGNIDTGIERIL